MQMNATRAIRMAMEHVYQKTHITLVYIKLKHTSIEVGFGLKNLNSPEFTLFGLLHCN